MRDAYHPLFGIRQAGPLSLLLSIMLLIWPTVDCVKMYKAWSVSPPIFILLCMLYNPLEQLVTLMYPLIWTLLMSAS